VFQNREQSGDGGLALHHIAKAIAPGQTQVIARKSAQDLAGGTKSETRSKDQTQTTLHLGVGIFVNDAEGIADEADGHGEGEGATLRFVEKAGSQARLDGVERECGNLAFESQQ
jgi:hypothetical protein